MHGHSIISAMVLVFAAGAASAAPSQIYVFGDSLVDAGNVFLATGGLIPSADQGYFAGRFTDGPTYVDILNKRLTGSLTAPLLGGGGNAAFGGARAAGDADFGIGVVPGLPTQLGLFLAASGGVVDPDGLYVLNFGNNDVNAIQSGDTYGLDPVSYGNLFAANIINSIAFLGSLGASNFLVVGVPNPTEIEGVFLQAQLDAALDAFVPVFPGTILRYDIMNFFTRVAFDPTAFGFPADIDLTGSCIANRPVVDGKVDCSGFLLFDGIHPVKEVHVLLANEIAGLAGLAIPEPASWAMMIAGFGLVGVAARRRRVAIS